MATPLEHRVGNALARWVDAVAHRPVSTLVVACLFTAATLLYLPGNLGMSGDTDRIFDESLPFRQLRQELERALPALQNNVLVVVDAPSELAASNAARKLAERIAAEPELFESVHAPGVGPFYDRHGLLYLEVAELEELADDLAAAQPFLAEVSKDASLRGVFGQLRRALEEDLEGSDAGLDLATVFQGVLAGLRGSQGFDAHPTAFGELILGRPSADGARRYVVVKPRIDWGDFVPARLAIERLREHFAQMDWNAIDNGIRARLTGELTLQFEELDVVQRQASAAGLASFLLVGAILGFALRSLRLIGATLATLFCGLVWTAGFAAVAIGHLNLISVAFAVLFIGLGVDFGIHFTLRYRELRAAGSAHSAALSDTTRGVGSSLVLCALTTAIGFYAFVPTGYAGVAELGIIAGTGMLISLFSTLTLLPALLSIGLSGRGPAPAREDTWLRLPSWPLRRPASVCAVAAALGVASAALLPRLHFDANPLRVRDPDSESVRTFRELIEGGDLNPWSIDLLATDLDSGEQLAARLERLPSVKRASTLRSYVPADQPEKLEILSDVALFLGLDQIAPVLPPTPQQELAAMADFADALRAWQPPDDLLGAARDRLLPALDRFLEEAETGEGEKLAAALRSALVGSVVERLDRLEVALEAGPVTLDDLPADQRERMLAHDGRARIEVMPVQDLNEDAALARFVAEVRSVAPGATGSSVYMFESARTVVAALVQAFSGAAIAVWLLLLLLWRNVRDPLLVLVPLLLAALLTAAASVLSGISINFADVIVLPLLLGIGIDSGIHLVHRHRGGEVRDLLATSTSRAVLASALTTIASFGSLGFSSHRGMASLGQLLTLGVLITVVCMLFVLPAMIAVRERRATSRARSSRPLH